MNTSDQKKPSSQPQQEPKVEDLFAEIDPSVVAQPQSQKPTPTVAPINTEQTVSHSPFSWILKMGRGSKIRLIGIAIAVGVIIIVGIIIAVMQRTSKGDKNATDTTQNGTPDTINKVEPVNTNATPTSGTSDQPTVSDSDGDGLLDSEEATLGTDPKKVDTDADGLSDRQEVRIYNTQPTNPDSDSDSHSDGDEVRNFYNPNGKGKMIDVIDAIEKYNTENQ